MTAEKRAPSPQSVIDPPVSCSIDTNSPLVQTFFGKQDLTVSPLVFLLSLLLGAGLSYHAGTMYKTQLIRLVSSQFGPKYGSHSKQDELMTSARYQRTIVNVAASSCEDAQCLMTDEMTLEEVFFAGEGYGQYGGGADEVVPNDEREDGPFAYQVMMDLQWLDYDFLTDQSRIQDAIFETIWEASEDQDLAIMSLHCQRSVGVRCVAVLKDGNHMSVATDPENLSCSLDVFLADTQKDLLDVVPILETRFGVGDKSRIVFRHLLRAVYDFRSTPLEHDLSEFLLQEKDRFYHKKEIGSTETNFQQIHVWEGIHTSLYSVDLFERSLEDGVDNYFTRNRDLLRPNRILFMDGVMQSTSKGDEAYHEALVHPAMFAHAEGPKRAAIIGGGEGATLREILKHKSIESCVMIEIDPGIVQAAREWLPRMNDCSDFGTGNCFDEERADLRIEDAFSWFLNRFNVEGGSVPENLETDQFDVIVMDALDPEDNVTFAVQLYKDEHLWGTMYEALSENGILVVQLGMTPRSHAYGEHIGLNKNRANLLRTIEAVGFSHMFIYHDFHSDFKFEWSYLAACKSEMCAEEWNRNEAQINLRIRERILPAKSGKPLLRYFDGATMQDYRRPHKSWENARCRQDPEPEECRIYRQTNHATLWSDAFDRLLEDGEYIFVAKMNLMNGSVLYHRTGTEDIMVTPLLSFPESVEKTFSDVWSLSYRNATCTGLTKKLADLNLNGKISPLRSRQPHIFGMEVLTRDVSRGDKVRCQSN